MEFGMSCRIKPKEKYVRISMKEIWCNLDSPSINKELWSYVVKFEFSRPKSSSCRGSTCIHLNTGTTCRYMYVTCGGGGGEGEYMYTFKYWNYLQIHVCHMWWGRGSACIHLNTGTTCRYMYVTCGGGTGVHVYI